ncbi:MAG: M48 family metallopeptidase [Chitinophagaceae bacterium]|nr:M48 family metallopeptidase [Chitinophagaceae bacterium]
MAGFSAALGQPFGSDLFKDDSLRRIDMAAQSRQKKDVLIKNATGPHARDYKKIYEDQFAEIDKLWSGTRAITAPQVQQYLQQLITKITSVNPDLANSDARIIFTRDWWPNAYSMGDGSIAVNAGLFIHLNNEAELIFVLCHELAHYRLDHTGKSIRKYVETINSDTYQSELKRLSKETYRVNQQLEKLSRGFLLSSRRHSRDNEAEADRQALTWMRRTGYDCNGIRSCLQLLSEIDQAESFPSPVLNQVFNFPEYPFKARWVQKESAIFSQMEAADAAGEKDSLRTHPDCEKRIALLADSLAGCEGRGQLFQAEENMFTGLKKELFPEIAAQCYRENQLSRHLYYSLQLLQADSAYVPQAAWSIARCLNTLYEKTKEHQIGSSVDKEGEEWSSGYNQLLRMLSRIRLEELAQLNFQFCRRYVAQARSYPGFLEEARIAEKRARLQ